MTNRTSAALAGILFLAALMMVASLGRWQLRGSDEPRYAQVAREMLERRAYILPHLNGEPYPDKPPLYFWLVALFSKPFGDVTALSARLPAALAACGMLLLLFLFGRRLFDTQTGILAAGILFTTEQFFSSATIARLDTLFAFWIMLALYLLYRGCSETPPRYGFCLLGWACTAGAILTKGPVGLVLPLLIMVMFLLLTKRRYAIRQLSLGTGLLFAAGICCLWVIPACLQGGVDYTRNILFRQSFGRVVESFAHEAPFYFYLLNFPIDFLPWTIFLPAALLYLWRTRARHPGVVLPLIWAATVFIFFSCLSGKRNVYLLPLYPAAALIMAWFLKDVAGTETASQQVCRWKLMVAPSYLTGIAYLAAGGGLIAFAFGMLRPVPIPAFSALFLIAAGCTVLALGGYVILKLFRSKMHPLQTVPILIGTCSLVLCLGLWVVMPAMDNRPEREFCAKIRTLVQPTDPLYASFEPEYFNYFLHRSPIPVIRDLDAAQRLVQSDEKIYFLLKDKDVKKLPDDIRQRLYTIDVAEIGHKTIYFLSNKPL
ncbi:MAG: glycosyltransferase family 39 protein [Desulfobacterota bacterium]|nr:glycosyltransferase family 39 protein [Thermodesulfobacteriota bacterium]